ncbi:MAG: LCP family protein [Intrasporangium sp.]|uniref:LCP family protein n=1 Tax=Intrasporangium sp. TaxID=1925024 RepID=UPI002647923F|nr:LCP family protein [Intrasporangium sp.]MDN5795453.1 LCP family protein [Intrasporangium sp.]
MRLAPHPTTRLVASATALLLLTGCSSGSTSPSASGAAVPTSGRSVSSTATEPTRIKGAPTELSALVERVYSGSDLGSTASKTAAAALEARTPVSGPISGKASTGSWKGQQVAVVTVGDDVTLAVAAKPGAWRVVGGWWPTLGVPKPALGSGPRWVLALGSDARKGQPLDHTRADTIQVVGTDGAGGAGLMGMARDLWVPLSIGGKGKINSAMALGGAGAQLKTVRSVTRLPIEGYVVIGFTGFRKTVDELGGIPIVIPRTVDASHAGILVKKGPQTLTGAEALAYARERKTLPDGDFGRSRHQGELLLAAAVKARLAGPTAMPLALTTVSRYTRTDLDAEQMLTFVARFYQVKPAEVGRSVARGAFGWAGGQSIVVLGPQARSLFADFADGNLS